MKIDHSKVVDRKNGVVKQLVAGVGMQMKRNKVTVINGVAAIDGKNADGFVIKVGDASTIAKAHHRQRLRPCDASHPRRQGGTGKGLCPHQPGDSGHAGVPNNLVVIGGGVIGLEMASYFNSIGSHVTVIEMLDKIAGPTEAEVSKSC